MQSASSTGKTQERAQRWLTITAAIAVVPGVFLLAFCAHRSALAFQLQRVAMASSSSLGRSVPFVPVTRDRTVIGTVPGGSAVPAFGADLPVPLPTNTWWSGGLTETWPAPLFAWPLSVTLGPTGAVIDAPGRLAQEKAVMHQDQDPLRVFSAVPAARASFVGAGDWDVTFRLRDAQTKPLFTVTTAQGSPFVFIQSAVASLSIALPAQSTVTPVPCSGSCGSALLVKGVRRTYVLVSAQKNGLSVSGAQVTATFPDRGGSFSIAVLAPGSKAEQYLPFALRAVRGTRASFAMAPATITTTFRFSGATLLGVLPHQYAALVRLPSALIGTYDTVRGPIRLYSGDSFQTVVQKPSLLPSPPPLTGARAGLLTQLRADIAAVRPVPGDDYAAGKELMRQANLVQVADALSAVPERTQALKTLEAALADWCTAAPGESGRYLGFDARAGGIVAEPPSFGSEHYNDHHFHYGYFIQAAAVAARFDTSFDRSYGECVRLLIRDIASFNRSDASFPYLRVFDAYAGHSWAGGLTFFADGNNQESSSEALQAWYAIALYGRTVRDSVLEQQGLWLWSQEAEGAKTYWLNTSPQSGVFPPGFTSPMASIVWGGKIDYATFFDGSDGAVRGIQFFPFSPALFPVAGSGTITRLLTPLVSTGPETIWKTNARFYDSLVHPSSPLPQNATLDPVYTLSYLWYWQEVARLLGAPAGSVAPCNGWLFVKNGKMTAVLYRTAVDPASCSIVVAAKSRKFEKLKEGWTVGGL